MNKLIIVVAAMVIVSAEDVLAKEISWTGGGGTSAWSEPANWSETPAEGDTAIFPSGVITVVGTDVTTFDLFSAFEIRTGAKLSFEGFNGTFKQTLTGGGTVCATDKGNSDNIITITGDNSGFTGTFAFTNQSVYLNSKYGLGTTNVVYQTVSLAPSTALRRSIELRGGAPSVLSNAFYFVGNSSKSPVIYNHWLADGVTLAGPVHLLENNVAFRAGHATAYWIGISGGITGSGMMSLAGDNMLRISGEPVRMTVSSSAVASANPVYANVGGNLCGDGGGYSIATTIESAYLNADPGGFKFLGANLSTANVHWGFSMGTHESGTYDMNGFDQDCGNICYMKNLPTATNPKAVITSEMPATLTMHGMIQYPYQSASDPVDKRARFPGCINGAVTFVLKSDLLASPGSIRFFGEGSTTSGGLIASNGTIWVQSNATFTNLTLLAAVDSGKIVLETAAIGTHAPKGLAVKASDSGLLTINDGLVLQAKTAFLAGKWVEPGDYGGPDAGLDEKHTCANLAGAGIVRVAEYGGPKGLMLLVR